MSFPERTADVVQVNELGHLALKAAAVIGYDKKLDNLTYVESVDVLKVSTEAGIRNGIRITQADIEGRVVVDSYLDGADATKQRLDKFWQSRVDGRTDESELVVHVMKDQTIWNRIRGREPQVMKTYIFSSLQKEDD